MSPQAAGVKRARTLVEITDDAGKTHGIYFGRESPKKDGAKGPREVYAKGTVDDALYLVGDFQRARFDRGLELFKKRSAPPGMNGQAFPGAPGNMPPGMQKKLQEMLSKQGQK